MAKFKSLFISIVCLMSLQIATHLNADTFINDTSSPNTICTTIESGPGETQIHKNIGTLTATMPDSLTITASTTAYARSVEVLPYRFNWGCTCNDTEAKNFLIGSNNSADFTDNKIEGWIFDESATPSLQQVTSLDLETDVIFDSAVYNNEDGMNIAILIRRQDETSHIILATATAPTYAFVRQSTTQIPSIAFKLQWFVAPDGTPHIITDENDGLSLYAVNLNNYTITRVASTPNLASGGESTFLYWLLQGTDIYVIQGYNGINVATYKVNFAIPSIETGVANDMSDDFAAISACSTCADYLALGGTTRLQTGAISLYSVDELGNLSDPILSRNIQNTFIIFYCERCCCTNNNLLVATSNGLYCLDTESLETVASNTSMPNNTWINTCWCCSETPTICTAVNTLSSPFIFKKEGTNLIKIYDL